MESRRKKGFSKSSYLLLFFFSFLLITWIFVFSFFSKSPIKKVASTTHTTGFLRGKNTDRPEKLVDSIYSNNDLKPMLNAPKTLVVVPGHAVMRMSKLNTAEYDDSAWYLLPYQREQGFPSIITSHIKTAIRIAEEASGGAVLVFSGGQTRKDVGPTSEAASYYYLAQSHDWIPAALQSRVFLEEFARDSFENLLFSICRFKEVTGSYPQRISVVGFDFKEERFTRLHRAAIGFPATNFSYVGISSRQESPQFSQDRAVYGEKFAIQSFEKDLYGCFDSSLRDKRVLRNPFRRTVPYLVACPEIVKLLQWCKSDYFTDKEQLPWNQ